MNKWKMKLLEKKRKVNQSKLKGGNVMRAVSTCEVLLVRYAG